MAMVVCKECGGKVSDKAATCPHCGAAVAKPVLKRSYGCGTLIFGVIVIGFLWATIASSLRENSSTASAPAQIVAPSRAAVACNTDAARKVKDLVQGLAKTSQDSGFIRVQWGNGFHAWGRDQQLQMAQTFANADACLSGSAREIRFYSPAGQFNAVATSSAGVRLID